MEGDREVARQPGSRTHERWAQLRFSVIGHLLAAPPAKGELQQELIKLAARTWCHPVTGAPVRFGVSTIERWLHKAKGQQDPLGVLERKPRKDAGTQTSMSPALCQAVRAQYAAHQSWSVQLHHDNLAALVAQQPELGPVPSYATLRRFLQAHGLAKQPRVNARQTAGALQTQARLAALEVRSYELEHVGALWHVDGHWGKKKVLTAQGAWQSPLLIGVLDDRSRLACHLQWYNGETAANLAHCLMQAMQKHGLPRALQSDNGSAMIAAEISQGLARLGILHQTTLPYAPWSNGKCETLWGPVEGRLLAMLEGVPDLTLARLNQATQTWIEHDYNHRIHRETGQTPFDRFLVGPEVSRPCPDSAALRLAFTRSEQRRQRKSDGTVMIEGRRFEVPNAYRHLDQLELRFASWDLTRVHLVDAASGKLLCRLFPQDKAKNASGLRRRLEPAAQGGAAQGPSTAPPADGVAPLLARLLEQQAQTGLPPAYLPQDDGDDHE